MNFLNKFKKNVINQSLVIYRNNTRLLKNKTNNWEKKFLNEFKEYAYEIVIFLETRNGWWFKIFCILLLAKPSLNRLYYIFGGQHDKMLQGAKIMTQVNDYQKDNLMTQKLDNHNTNKILYSYWTNYL